jgi:hypothetical protein
MEVIDFLLYLYLMKQGEKISGRVVRYLEDKNYGFIESDKGDTFYFKS